RLVDADGPRIDPGDEHLVEAEGERGLGRRSKALAERPAALLNVEARNGRFDGLEAGSGSAGDDRRRTSEARRAQPRRRVAIEETGVLRRKAFDARLDFRRTRKDHDRA